ncbi:MULTISPECIES: MraY family glycosyltransferase [Pseudomonas]|uniref:MraY family glycosyltransferase n=1 Tax=Pseudomonas TaxID=286 RepID=UPI000D204F55|nr:MULTISPECIES: glycosyltransferase family 4 protein [Pseudomonas]AVX90390.1 glycosyl transferase [Pseudomonas koreensis]MBI6948170.1 glycosyltransferase family 4 protein [Pseudomonas koreensis]MCU7215927.1 glycosyltransferase family 4 protein [Pseudomonas sp. VE 196-7]
MIFCGLLLAVFVASLVLTYALRNYALANSLIDIPNTRSSHTIPTPRGGGVAIVVAFLIALPVSHYLQLIDLPTLIGLSGAGALVAVLGFADDHGHIAARWRLVGHFAAAGWALYWLDGGGGISLFGYLIDLKWLSSILFAVYLVWMLNLYNFMDGIDGLASVEAISVCLSACLVYWMAGHQDLSWMPLLMAGSVAGFLCWNFPPARIFMGDAGSGFLGLIIGLLAIIAGRNTPDLLWCWLILLGVFIVDATWTLLRRLVRGEKIYEAHRSHAYQYASRHYGNHKTVVYAVLAINLLWLTPVAILTGIGLISGLLAVFIAYIPLVLLACKYKAGLLETPK